MMRITNTILFFIILVFSSIASATLELELTQGVSNAIPIAISQFKINDKAGNLNGIAEDVISNDLKNSGRFSVIKSTDQNIDYAYWHNQKVDNLINGEITIISNGKCKVSFQLHDVLGKSVLLAEDFNIPVTSLRSLSHHISDLVYEKLIGTPGIFSTRIAYVLVKRQAKMTKYFLEVSDQDGAAPQVLLTSSEPIMSPAWSPDGKKIAYVSFEGHRATIFMQNILSGEREMVSNFPGINGAPAWSPDGKKIALVLTKTDIPKIYILDLASKNLQQLTFGNAIDTEPAFAPDGHSLVFTSNREGDPQIYQLDLASGAIKRLTYEGNYNARPSFARDGKNIIILHEEDGMFNIATFDIGLQRVINLSRTGYDESPSFAPNGQMIVYATNKNGQGILAEISIDGKVMLKLPAIDGEVQEPAWQPFRN